MILGDGTEVRTGNTYGQGEVGDKRGSKEMDRGPLTVRASSTVSRCLAEAFAKNSKPKGFEDIVLML
jgi:hypothetical protein